MRRPADALNIAKPPGAFHPERPQETSADLAAETARWQREAFAPAAAGRDRRFVTDTGIPLEPLYTPAHLAENGFDYLRDLGFPGRVSVHARRPRRHEPHRSVRRLGLFRVRRRRGVQPALPQADRDRHGADSRGARSADPVRLRLRPRDGDRGGRQCRRRDRHRSPTWSFCSTASRPTASSASARSAIRSARSCSRCTRRSARSRASAGTATRSTCRTIRSRSTSRAARRSCRPSRPPSSRPTRSPGASSTRRTGRR